MRFASLFRAAVQGALHQIPFLGPIIQAIEGSVQEGRLREALERLTTLIEQQQTLDAAGITQAQFETDLRLMADSGDRRVASTLLLAEAAASRPTNRFLYLAGTQYASALTTAEIATVYGFLWRSYHGNRRPPVAIPRVDRIRAGDLIVLGYRVRHCGTSHFRACYLW